MYQKDMISVRTNSKNQRFDFYIVDGEVFDLSLKSRNRFQRSRTNQNLSLDHHSVTSFRLVMYDKEALIDLISDFFIRSNIYVFGLKFTEIRHCQALHINLTERELLEMDLDNHLLYKSFPRAVTSLNKIVYELEEKIASSSYNNEIRNIPINLATQQAVANKLFDFVLPKTFKQSSSVSSAQEKSLLPKFVILEQTLDSKPFKVASLPFSLVKKHQIESGQVLSIFDDFNIRTVLYKVGMNPLEQFPFIPSASSVPSSYANSSVMSCNSPLSPIFPNLFNLNSPISSPKYYVPTPIENTINDLLDESMISNKRYQSKPEIMNNIDINKFDPPTSEEGELSLSPTLVEKTIFGHTSNVTNEVRSSTIENKDTLVTQSDKVTPNIKAETDFECLDDIQVQDTQTHDIPEQGVSYYLNPFNTVHSLYTYFTS